MSDDRPTPEEFAAFDAALATLRSSGSSDLSPIAQHAKAIYDAQTERLATFQAAVEDASTRRAGALAALYDSGLSYKEVGALVGLSSARVGQIITALNRCRPATPASAGEPKAPQKTLAKDFDGGSGE